MSVRFRMAPIDVMLLAAIAGYGGYAAYNRRPPESGEASSFSQQVDVDLLSRTAVHADGRLRSFASHAKTYMGYVSGPRLINGQSPGFTFLDLMFRPEQYADTDVVYVKNKNVRSLMVNALEELGQLDPNRASRIIKAGLVSHSLLTRPEIRALLQRLGQDLIRTSKSVEAINSAVTVSDPAFLLDSLRMVAPPQGRFDQPWLPIHGIGRREEPAMGDTSDHAGRRAAVDDLDAALGQKIGRAWSDLATAWRNEDAAGVNAQLAGLAEALPRVSPSLYPSLGRLAMESWYFRNKGMTWVWLLYLTSVVPLLMAVVYQWSGARRVGMVLFVLAFSAHTASVGIRWYISGRWPNANMFEALTTSAWFGGVAAIVLERIARHTAFRNLFVLGAAVTSMAALMAAYFLPAQLDSSISNKMAALNDVWLYIHTNMIIWSYAVIAIACVPALLLLRHRWCVLWDAPGSAKLRLLILPVAVVVLNYTAYLLLMHFIDNAARGLHGQLLLGVIGAFGGSAAMVLSELAGRRTASASGDTIERSAAGGASALLAGSRGGSAFLRPRPPTATQVYDAATMVLVELAFIMLWTGVVMGAIWADHSWGRPWGWDPKEVFALNTFIIFLILIHVRLKVRDRAFWTAVLAVAGFEVMMFNWIVVNFVITGLHSYA